MFLVVFDVDDEIVCVFALFFDVGFFVSPVDDAARLHFFASVCADGFLVESSAIASTTTVASFAKFPVFRI